MTPDLPARTRYGRTDLMVSALCVGTSGWSALTVDDCVDLLGAASEQGLNFVDTANIYAGGRSEELLGSVRTTTSVLDATVLQTKLDRDVETGDFGYEQMFISLRQSLERLQLDRVPVLMLHDPENIGFEPAMAPGGPVDALVEMRAQGLADSIGISGGPTSMLQQFVETDLFDTLITHNRFTLLDRSAEALLDAATARDLGVTNAAPFGAGLLTGDPRFAGSYGYAPIGPGRQAAYRRMVEICRSAGVPIGAAALQFSLRDPRIHSTVVGLSTVDRLTEATTWAATTIDDGVWAELEAALPAASEWLDPPA
jgi:D-threo-aldose 1-dehydrogenase